MNLKNSWKEFRIWLGWDENIIIGMLLMILLGMGIVCVGWLLYWYPHMKTVSSERFYEIASTITYPFLVYLFYIPIFAFLSIFVTIVSIRKKPRNWRLVIEDAKEFQKKFGENSTIKFWMVCAKKERNGRPLFEMITRLREINQLKNGRDKIPSNIELETQIRELESERDF